MALIPVDPWRFMQEWQRDMERMTGRPSGSKDDEFTGGDWTPAVDIREEEDRYLVHADIPGVAPKDIEVSAENGMLTIKGERTHESTVEEKGYKRIERSSGSFFRRFSLPEDADAEKITATSKDGVLELEIPKGEAAKPRRIEVQSEG